ncbi:phage regulatory CII family protein [Brucella intermedia]|uniref:phage regulatory CII family protein n=1 Tax=Brucella intermedia TaxID=94625 RepID=UPI00235EEF75|nr:phage regulatory CII family protein [Brucella intermedia]
MRTISEPERRTLKAATDGAYVLSGGISRILDFTRVSTSQLSKYASFGDDNADSFVPVDVAIEIDRAAKSPVIVKEMAALLGYGLIPLRPDSDQSEYQAVTEADGYRALKETMDVVQAVIDARADGGIDAADRKNVRKEIREAIRELEGLDKALEVNS